MRSFTVYKGYYLVPFAQDVGEGRHLGHCEIHARYPKGDTAVERITTEGLHAGQDAAIAAAREAAQAVVDALVGPTPSPSERPWDSR